jgi:hypothetical protein
MDTTVQVFNELFLETENKKSPAKGRGLESLKIRIVK